MSETKANQVVKRLKANPPKKLETKTPESARKIRTPERDLNATTR